MTTVSLVRFSRAVSLSFRRRHYSLQDLKTIQGIYLLQTLSFPNSCFIASSPSLDALVSFSVTQEVTRVEAISQTHCIFSVFRKNYSSLSLEIPRVSCSVVEEKIFLEFLECSRPEWIIVYRKTFPFARFIFLPSQPSRSLVSPIVSWNHQNWLRTELNGSRRGKPLWRDFVRGFCWVCNVVLLVSPDFLSLNVYSCTQMNFWGFISQRFVMKWRFKRRRGWEKNNRVKESDMFKEGAWHVRVIPAVLLDGKRRLKCCMSSCLYLLFLSWTKIMLLIRMHITFEFSEASKEASSSADPSQESWQQLLETLERKLAFRSLFFLISLLMPQVFFCCLRLSSRLA